MLWQKNSTRRSFSDFRHPAIPKLAHHLFCLSPFLPLDYCEENLTHTIRYFFLTLDVCVLTSTCASTFSPGSTSVLIVVLLEPISKLLQEHRDTGELHTPEKIGGVVLPANEETSFPLQPGKEAFDEPAAFVPPEVAAILGLEFPSRAMHCHRRGPQ